MPEQRQQPIVIDQHQVPMARLIVLKAALKCEIAGLGRRGKSAYKIIQEETGLRGSKQEVLDQLQEYIDAALGR